MMTFFVYSLSLCISLIASAVASITRITVSLSFSTTERRATIPLVIKSVNFLRSLGETSSLYPCFFSWKLYGGEKTAPSTEPRAKPA